MMRSWMKFYLPFLALANAVVAFSSIEGYASNQQNIQIENNTKNEKKELDIYEQVENLYFGSQRPNNNILPHLEKNLKSGSSFNPSPEDIKKEAYKACLYLKTKKITNYTSYFESIRKYAQQGGENNCDPFIVYVLASLYEKGTGTKQDINKAINLYKLSHKRGNPRGKIDLNRVGIKYLLGDDVQKDEKLAFELFQTSSDYGNLLATYNLARCYEEGKGVEQNLPHAFVLFKKISGTYNSKTVDALFKMADFLQTGKGVEKNYQQAIEVYTHITSLLTNQDIEKQNICKKNLEWLSNNLNPNDIKSLDKTLEFYEEIFKLENQAIIPFFPSLKASYKKLVSHQDFLQAIAILGELNEKIKESLLLHAPKLFTDSMDKNDKLNILKVLNSFKTVEEIEKFANAVKNLFSHNSFPKKILDNFRMIEMIQQLSEGHLETLDVVLANSSLLFTSQMTTYEALEIIQTVNKINDLEKVKEILSYCPTLFIKQQNYSSEDDKENQSVKVLWKTNLEMDGTDRARILQALGRINKENLPMAFLCLQTVVHPQVKVIDIIEAIEDVEKSLQPQQKENNFFEIQENNEDQNIPIILSLDKNKLPLMIPFISTLFNGKESMGEKIQIFNEIGKVDLHQIESFMKNAGKLILKTMSPSEKIAIFQATQGIPPEDVEKILPYTVKIIKKDTNGVIIAKIFEILNTIEDTKKIEQVYLSTLKFLTEKIIDEQKPVALKIFSEIPEQERKDFVFVSQQIIDNKLNPEETERLLLCLKEISFAKRTVIVQSDIIKGKNTEQKLRILESLNKVEIQEEHFKEVLTQAESLTRLLTNDNFEHELDSLMSTCKSLNTIEGKDNKRSLIFKCASLFKKDTLKDLLSILNSLNRIDTEKLSDLEQLIKTANGFAQDSVENIEKGLTRFNKLSHKEIKQFLPYVLKLLTPSTTFEDTIYLVPTFAQLSEKGCEIKDIVSFITFEQKKPQPSLQSILKVLDSIEDLKVLKGVLKNTHCLEMISPTMDLQEVMDIFNITHNLPEEDLKRVAPYVALFLSKEMNLSEKGEKEDLIKRLIQIKPNELQTIVFHTFISLSQSPTKKKFSTVLESVSEEILQTQKLILKEFIPMEDFTVFCKFASKIYYEDDKFPSWNVKETQAILELLIKEKDINRFKILLQDNAEHLEKLFKKKYLQWHDLSRSSDIMKIRDQFVYPLFYESRCSLENLKRALVETCKFITEDMKDEDIGWVFNNIRWCVGTNNFDTVLSEVNKFLTKDMSGKSRHEVLYTITRSVDKKDPNKLENLLQITHKLIDENTPGDSRVGVLKTIFHMSKEEREKLLTYAPYALPLFSIKEERKELGKILNALLKFKEEDLKLASPYILEIIELETQFNKKHNYKNYHEIDEKLEMFSHIPMDSLEKICESVKKLNEGRYNVEESSNFTATYTSSTTPLLRILMKIDMDKHHKIVSYALESEKIYQEYHKGHKTSSMGDTVEELGFIHFDKLDKVFTYGKEYIKMKAIGSYTDYGYSHISPVFKAFANVKEEKDFEPIHNFVQLCIHDEMDRNKALSIVSCLASKFISISEQPCQFFIKGLKYNKHTYHDEAYSCISNFLYLFSPLRTESSVTLYLEEILPCAQDLRKLSIGYEELNSFEENSLFFNTELLENVNEMYSKYRRYSDYKDREPLLLSVVSNMSKFKEINAFSLIGILKAIKDLLTDEVNRNMNAIQNAFDCLNEEIFQKSENKLNPKYAFFRKKASNKEEIEQSTQLFKEYLKKPPLNSTNPNEDRIN